MKFLKAKNNSKWSITDNNLYSNAFGRYIMNGTAGLRLPKGTTEERPLVTNSDIDHGNTGLPVRVPGDANGYIRYNTSLNIIEAYVGGNWEIVTAPASTGIYKQTLGPGDYTETIFGPLDRDPVSDDNILVLVENVFQISQTNFNILYNYQGSGDAYIQFTSPVPLDKYITIYFGFSN
jgi:hypothetical protein